MNGATLRILIAESNYLIGLEAERIITEARLCLVMICRRDDLKSALTQSRFDLVFVEAAATGEGRRLQSEMVRTAGARLAFIHTRHIFDSGPNDHDGTVYFEKPFDEYALAAFIKAFPLPTR